MPDGSAWPHISVVTPSFNQGCFLEGTVRSILLQGYPNLEYFVFDGGSKDESIDIIKKYEPWLKDWVSEPDAGQSAAINAGLRRSSGLLMTWINSDDMLHRDALVNHALSVGFHAATVYVGDCVYIDEHDHHGRVHRARVNTFRDLVRVRRVWRAPGNPGHIDQPAVLFPRELALEVGGLNAMNHRTMDYELWGKFFLAGARFMYTHIRFGMFREHDQQKTAQGWAQTRSLVATAARLVEQARDMPETERSEILAELVEHEREYWRGTGRLARVGLPEPVVGALRQLYARLRN